MQTARMSAAEAFTNTVLSFAIAWLVYRFVIPILFNINIDSVQSVGIVLVFNVVSLVRQFVLRRIFNKWDK